nr:MAG TPA_asm: Helix-turn-helix XRE-family like protein [Caudoviricetes sp.]
MDNKIKEFMELRKINIAELHKQTGISRNSLNLIINKKHDFKVSTLVKISEVLEVSSDELLGIKKDDYLRQQVTVKDLINYIRFNNTTQEV